MPEIVQLAQVGEYDAQVERGAKMLSDGGIVVLPTETVYGAAGLLSRPKANARLRAIRQSDKKKPFILHLANSQDAAKYVGEMTELAQRMIRKLWPGPVAMIFDVPPARRAEVATKMKLPQSDLYEGSQITLRCPDHQFATDILAKVAGPVALTLVDASNWSALEDKVDLIYDAGPSKYSKPSTIVHVLGDHYQIVREGVYDKRIIERLMRTTFLFICSGNTCRSPMSEALARLAIARKLGVAPDQLDSKGISVISAGSFAMPGARATPQAVDAIRAMGGDLSKHRSRPLSVELIHQADHIYTMGKAHAAAVTGLVPSAKEKTSLLNPDGDIEDPIGGELALYQSLAKQLNELIENHVVAKAFP
jgi:L-threonylcarbamoyladenylate synthase